jgi:hypothetical protein
MFIASNVIDGERVLDVDLDATAYSASHIASMVFSFATLCTFTIGTPIAALAALIFFYARDLLGDSEVFTMFGFLYAGYKKKYFWWEMMVLLRKVLATVIALVPIGVELQAICAVGLLLVLIVIQLVVRPFKDERINVLDCMSMGSVALKQLCALAFHHVTMNAVDTDESDNLVTRVSWISTALVFVANVVLICYFVFLFSKLKLGEVEDERRITVTDAQNAWITGEPLPLTRTGRAWVLVRSVAVRIATRGVVDDAVADDAAAVHVGASEAEAAPPARRGCLARCCLCGRPPLPHNAEGSEAELIARKAIGLALERLDATACTLADEADEHLAEADESSAFERRVLRNRDDVIALKYIAGECVDEGGWILMERVPLRLSAVFIAKLCPYSSCCRNRRVAYFNVNTAEIEHGAEHIKARQMRRTVTRDVFNPLNDALNESSEEAPPSTAGITGIQLHAI